MCCRFYIQRNVPCDSDAYRMISAYNASQLQRTCIMQFCPPDLNAYTMPNCMGNWKSAKQTLNNHNAMHSIAQQTIPRGKSAPLYTAKLHPIRWVFCIKHIFALRVSRICECVGCELSTEMFLFQQRKSIQVYYRARMIC